MTIPSSTGLGQGSAQVFDTSNLAKIYGQQQAAEAEKKAAEKKALETKLGELTGEMDGVFKEKYFATRDDAYIRGLHSDIQREMAGKWHLVADPSTAEARRYRELNQNMMFEAKKSQEAKELSQPYIQDFGKNRDEYEPESKMYIKEFLNTPGAIFDPTAMKKVNNFNVDESFNKNIGNYREEIKLANKVPTYYTDADGRTVNQKITKSTPEQEQDYLDTWISGMQQNAKASDMVERTYGKLAKERQDLGENIDAWGVLRETYSPKVKINLVDITAGAIPGGSGDDKDVFNEENIQPFDANISETETVGTWDGIIGATKGSKSFIYDTGEARKATVPINSETINATTGKPVKTSGSYEASYGSPIVLWFNKDGSVNSAGKGDPKVMVPGRVTADKGDGSKENITILQPLRVMGNVYGKNWKQIESGLLSKANGGGSSSYNINGKSYSLSELQGMGYTEQQVSKYKAK